MNGVVIKPATPAQAPKVEFKRAVIEEKKNLVMSCDGLPKTGKTEFMLSMPAPLCIHNFNFGLKGVIDKHVSAGKEIYVFDYHLALSRAVVDVAAIAPKTWDAFVRQFLESLKEMRSVGVDMGGEAWDLVRMARLGKLTQVLPVQYVNVNAEFRQLIQEAIRSGTNVVFLHKLKPEYKDDKKTNNLERAGFGDIGFDMEAVLRTSRDYSKKGVDQFSATLEECRARFEASGKVFTGAEVNFANVATTIYPNSKIEDWQ